MRLRPGVRLESATCETQVIVVRAPAAADVDLRCGGVPMRELGTGAERTAPVLTGESPALGKRYADEEIGLEVLCTRAGQGALTLGEAPIFKMGAKPLPASD